MDKQEGRRKPIANEVVMQRIRDERGQTRRQLVRRGLNQTHKKVTPTAENHRIFRDPSDFVSKEPIVVSAIVEPDPLRGDFPISFSGVV